MYKVTFDFKKSKPEGGSAYWTTDWRLYEETLSAEELEKKIREYMADDHCGYHKYIQLKSIEKI